MLFNYPMDGKIVAGLRALGYTVETRWHMPCVIFEDGGQPQLILDLHRLGAKGTAQSVALQYVLEVDDSEGYEEPSADSWATVAFALLCIEGTSSPMAMSLNRVCGSARALQNKARG